MNKKIELTIKEIILFIVFLVFCLFIILKLTKMEFRQTTLIHQTNANTRDLGVIFKHLSQDQTQKPASLMDNPIIKGLAAQGLLKQQPEKKEEKK
jgi:hypothetical protein